MYTQPKQEVQSTPASENRTDQTSMHPPVPAWLYIIIKKKFFIKQVLKALNKHNTHNVDRDGKCYP